MVAKTHTLVNISTLPKIISQKIKRSSRKVKRQDIKLNQLKLGKHVTYGTVKKTANFEPVYDKDVTNKTYLNEKF